MIYVVSDLHGCYEKYIKLLEIINLTAEDKLYILGDIIDRGDSGIKILLDIMKRKNVIPMLGNHEHVAYMVLSRLNVEVTEDNFDTQIDFNTMRLYNSWVSENGGYNTLMEFEQLHHIKRKKVLEYISDFTVYEELNVNGQDYILVHAGLGNFSKDKSLDEYTLDELLWERMDYNKQYYDDKILVSGHTPTCYIDNEYMGKIYKGNNHIAIDCAAVFGGRLGCICLDTGEEFYV